MGLLSKLGPIGRSLAFWKVLRDRSVPWWGKLGFVVSSLTYFAIPTDLVPDLPVIGWVDDLVAMAAFGWFFTDALPRFTRSRLVRWWMDRHRRRRAERAAAGGVESE